jgi:hypothetical protein
MKRLTSMEMKFLAEEQGSPFFITKGMKKFWKG